MNIKYLAAFIIPVLVPFGSYGQTGGESSSTDDALAPVNQLFDGMRAGDSTMVRDAFHPIARLVSAFDKDGMPAHHVTSIDEFVKAIGKPHEKVYDEEIWDIQVNLRDNLATAWMKYAFFIGDEFSHCGVDAFDLLKTVDGWKIMHVADTRQTENCEMPPEGIE